MFRREQLDWIDIERFPGERDAERSTDFGDPSARAALAAFRAQYEALLGLR